MTVMSREKKGRQHLAAGPGGANALKVELARLAQLPIEAMKRIWRERIETDLPNTKSQALFRRMLAWQLQVEAYGGLDAVTEKKLVDIANAIERDGQYEPKVRRNLPIGVVLTREWKGVLHKVTVAGDGFTYQGRNYRSLSDVARTITGTRWSGPRFFGLEQKTKRPAPAGKAAS